MPRIFDNINDQLLPILKQSLQAANRADFCVGYFNLRGWKLIQEEIAQFTGGENNCCRLLIGMQKLPKDELHEMLGLGISHKPIDTNKSFQLQKRIVQEFRQQLMIGKPNNADELGLKRLKSQLKSKKVVVKLYLRHPLHAKLYLIPQNHPNLPTIGFLGSSNLTFSGLSAQGELNVDILDHDAANKLQTWFNERWEDRFCLDISEQLADIIDESWATDRLIDPYYVYLKMAYHLSQEARDGLSQYQIPSGFQLLPFQAAAVKIASHYVNRRGGVIVGDVVGLGKTLVGTAIAKIIEEDFGISTLIICPKNLVSMWKNYQDQYGLRGKVISINQVGKILPNNDSLHNHRLVLIDESHNLRNREGQRYAVIKEYIEQSGSRCILLTATPYNKSYFDLSAQLGLFIPESKDLGIKPENLIRELGNEQEFKRKHPQTNMRTLAAFEKSEYSEDWQQLMNRYMIRRTRSFIKNNYAEIDPVNGRKYLQFPDGTRSYFPLRIPKTAKFNISNTENDNYGKLYASEVVEIINSLSLPRYGLGNYTLDKYKQSPTATEQQILNGLSRAGRRLMGFCRTNLFKRLESSGIAFLESLERHILRNYVYLYGLENNLDIPIGTQDAEFLDTCNNDEDADTVNSTALDFEIVEDDHDESDEISFASLNNKEAEYKRQAAAIYQLYQNKYQKRFKWLNSRLFNPELKKHLRADALLLLKLLNNCGEWNYQQDQKFQTLQKLLTETHPDEKILIFTQFADTGRYLQTSLAKENIQQAALVTGKINDPTALAYRFSPGSNKQNIPQEQQIRILIATDVLSEGQNLQDCRIIINYDLPWAIIRLIQRAGRVDRIGQKASEILCYSFLPAEGVEELINLRGRLGERLQENANVVGTDESFFEDTLSYQEILDLYHEKSSILDEDEEGEVDLTSEAFQIWKNAIDADPDLEKIIQNLPNVIYSTRYHQETKLDPEGVLMYLRTADGTDALAWINREGKSVTQSQMRILRIARCNRNTPPLKKHPQHHEIVSQGADLILEQQKTTGGQLGSSKSARYRTYYRLDAYIKKTEIKTPLFVLGEDWQTLKKAVEEIYLYPLKETTVVKLNRQLKSGITDEQLATMIISLRDNNSLCVIHPEDIQQEAQIICSLGLFSGK
ncbi:phospholipase D-like domain-containing protein [Dolichospermum sp. ST_con]|nr:phospholipase D-like domain-containing protein [Dolichospermum sp. ST_con]MDD1421671.1 phospholipase D-like domain-containing protein [Dolichospermum sp. ST_sed1]MDD1422895.1 phospholipase D-like domain-containing protein [Dolichospermum sp. ST_sed9]MDD1430650.1 phospholipase D-like domain-containing protein [Dolichospermum sp. ST_sed6]MDD1442984.1 phospholipase D-like domain-containing protein [Dolichospermum sp. ST_sed3]MDD1445861.1 phospholipase D-like domain-containing protein [Dolichos